MYEKLRNLRTIHPGAVSLVLKYAQNLNENCHEISRRLSIARFGDIARKVEGGYISPPPPPPGYIGLKAKVLLPV